MVPYPVNRFFTSFILGLGTAFLVIYRTAERGNELTSQVNSSLAVGLGIIVLYITADFVYYQIRFRGAIDAEAGSVKSKELKQSVEKDNLNSELLLITLLTLAFPYIFAPIYLYKSRDYTGRKKTYVRYLSIFGLFVAVIVVLTLALSFANMSSNASM